MHEDARGSIGPGRVALVVALLAVAALPYAAAPVLRLTWAPLARLGWAAALAAPWAALLVLRGRRRSRVRAAAVAVVASLGGLAVVAAAVRALSVRPMTVERLSVTPMGGYDLVVQRAGCGPRCVGSVALAQEWRLLPGLVRVREVGRWRPARTATVAAAGRDSVWITIPPYSPGQPSTATEQRLALDPSPY